MLMPQAQRLEKVGFMELAFVFWGIVLLAGLGMLSWIDARTFRLPDVLTLPLVVAGLAQAWLLRGDSERARRLLTQAIAIEPSYEVAHLVLSRLWLQQGDLQRALQVMTSFLAAHPDSPGACQQTTLILQRLGHKAEAKRMGQHAVRLLEARALDHEAAAMNEVLATI